MPIPAYSNLFDIRAKQGVINYIVDGSGWVQHRRAEYLMRYQSKYRLRIISIKRFKVLWRLGFLRRQPTIFTSWRLARQMMYENPDVFTSDHLKYFLAAVTSHSNIGGGLDPLNPIPGRTPEDAYANAVEYLKRFGVVTANSKILCELLKPGLPNVMYCPTGVDIDLYAPAPRSSFDANHIRIGWVGKERGPKNFATIETALEELSALGFVEPHMIKVDKGWDTKLLSPEEMRNYYCGLDFYLCASWNEGTPNPALEAAACGVPVITTSVGNMRELIRDGENGYFVEPTAESIVERVSELRAMTPEQYQEMSAAIRSDIEAGWTWPTQIGNFVDVFDALTI